MKRFSLTLLLLFAGIGIGYFCFAGPRGFQSPLPTNEALATLEFDNTDEATFVVRINGQQLLDRLIIDPLRKAEPDPRPLPYRVLADLVYFENGVRKKALLFTPWGRVRIEGKYLIADLSELKQFARHYLKETYEMAQRE